MIPATIGLPSTRKGLPQYDAMQEWLYAHGMTPYMPYLRYATSYNLGMMTDVVGKTLARTSRNGSYGLSDEAVAETQRFGFQDFFHYGDYYYSKRPDTLRWIGADGVSRNQDQLTVRQLTDYLAIALDWCEAQRIHGYILVDELSHPGPPDNPGKWGWSPQVEARGLKFIQAAQDAGWMVVFCAPPAAAVEYWHGKGVRPDRWAVTDDVTGHAAKLARVLALTKGTPVWLYNSTQISGLADRIRAYNPTTQGGYLHYSGVWKEAPLFTAAGGPTDLMWQLLAEAERADKPLTIEGRLDALERRVAVLEEEKAAALAAAL